jgi:ABC-type transport system involved in cytochrome c biogenesis permease subunit
VLIVVMLVGALVALFKSPRDNSAFAALPVGLYAGWLSAATCVSLGLLTAGYGWISADTAGLIFVTLAILVAAAVQSTLMRAPTYGIAVIWALVGVVVQNYSTSPSVAALAAGGAIALLLPTFRSWRKN